MVGRTVSHYRILRKIGAGGMGEVYCAHDEQLDRDVALKVLLPEKFSNENARARLLREARSAAALNHPNICTIHEVGEAEGQGYIAMELVEGQCLSDSLQAQSLPAEAVLHYGSQIADALAHAHERHVIHRDLKCGNVVITPEGRAKVLDFGLAKRQLGEELSEATTQSHACIFAAVIIILLASPHAVARRHAASPQELLPPAATHGLQLENPAGFNEVVLEISRAAFGGRGHALSSDQRLRAGAVSGRIAREKDALSLAHSAAAAQPVRRVPVVLPRPRSESLERTADPRCGDGTDH